MCGKFNLAIFSLVILCTLVEAKHGLHGRITKHTLPTTKPGGHNPMATAAPGMQYNTPGKPTPIPGAGGMTVIDEPGAGGHDPKPTVKPGGGGGGGNGKPRPKVPPPPPLPKKERPVSGEPDGIPPPSQNFTYLGWGAGKYWWVGNSKTNREDADYDCENLRIEFEDLGAKPFDNFNFYLTVIEDRAESEFATQLFNEHKIDDTWSGRKSLTTAKGEEVFLEKTPGGIKMMDAKAANRNKREQLISHSNPFGKKKRNVEPGAARVTIKETHYPWLKDWKEGGGGCRSIVGCEPVHCTVTTEPCILQPTNCALMNDTQPCHLVGTGTCSAICENCDITRPPECWMAENKCTVVRERHCKMKEPECSAVTPKCTITRPPCITRPSPCNVHTTKPPDCVLPPLCGTPQGVFCTEIDRECYPEELEKGLYECTKLECTPSPLCLMPEYCRESNGTVSHLDCPPPITFCPPEVVKCPPPEITCEEPHFECTEPEVYCPPPQVICTQPQVSCTSPAISCPTVVAQCLNPNVVCTAPEVFCDLPKMECTEPKPCFIPPETTHPMCNIKCDDPENCKCNIIQKGGDKVVTVAENCDALHKPLCVGHRGA